MGSQSSQQNAPWPLRGCVVAPLLVDGVQISSLNDDQASTIGTLKSMGMVHSIERRFVRCANPDDQDYSKAPHSCNGRIELHDDFDEEAGDYRCSSCERNVFPCRHDKAVIVETSIHVLPMGVRTYVREILECKDGVVSESGDVFRVMIGLEIVYVCIAEYCKEHPYLTRDWATQHRVCYVLVKAESLKHRFIQEDWITMVTLSDLICQGKDLVAIIEDLAKTDLVVPEKSASVSVYPHGIPPVYPPTKYECSPSPLILEVGVKSVRINGVQVVAPQGNTRRAVMAVLFDQFLDDLTKHKSKCKYTVLRLADIYDRIVRGDFQIAKDQDSFRRDINRMMVDISKTLQQATGHPVGNNDVIETVPWTGNESEYGYRLNSQRVVIKPS